MFRQSTETNLKWMLTASLLFHLTVLSVVFSPHIFSKSDLFSARYTPLTAIQVSIVNLPNDNPQVMPAPSTAVTKIEKNLTPVKKINEIKKKEDVRPVAKIEKLKEVTAIKDEKAAVSEPVKKEIVIEKPKEPVTGSGSGVKGQGETSQLTKIMPGEGLVSGPAVDLPSFKYDYYLVLIKNKVDSRWSQPVAHSKTRQALIEFTINRKGDIRNVRIADSSGDNYFDQTAVRAVTLSNPFPPLPRGFKDDILKINYRFIFSGKS